jgi:hypothetical protein
LLISSKSAASAFAKSSRILVSAAANSSRIFASSPSALSFSLLTRFSAAVLLLVIVLLNVSIFPCKVPSAALARAISSSSKVFSDFPLVGFT